MSEKHVIVVGGGAIGTACAYCLAKAGCRVTLVDRDRQGAGCSDGNCGLLAYSHVLPLAEPGAVAHALRTIWRSDSPLWIKPRLDPALWSWLVRFALRCRERPMLQSAEALAGLIRSSHALYDELLAEESLDCEWEGRGCLFVYRTPGEMQKYAEIDRLLRERFDTPAVRYDGDAVVGLEPSLKSGLAGGWHYEDDGHLRPERLLSSWRAVLERLGVAIREQCDVRGFAGSGSRAAAAETADGPLEADAFVVATGALTPLLSRHLGCRIPIQPGKGYSITMPRPSLCPAIPIIFQEHKVVATPLRSGYRLGSTMELAGYDETLDPGRLGLLKRAAEVYLREPYAEPVEWEWFGWRPMTYDSLPMLGPSPARENLYIAAGHNMLGLTLAPATGRLIAELITGKTPHLDLRPFSPTRF
jgi:D-amino-acid dehydrogenase